MPMIPRGFPPIAIVASVMWLLLATLLANGTASAQEWRYRVRPGDTIWDLSRKHLRQDVPWQRLQAHNEVDDPWHMAPGIELRVPVAWLRVRPAPAVVAGLYGQASASPANAPGDAVALRVDMRLDAGTVIRTEADANLTLRFADGSRLQLHGDSELRLDKLSAYGATGMVDTRMRLIRGRSTSSAAHARGPASRFIVDSPGTMASVRGTEFRVGHEAATRTTRSEVLDGRVEVRGGGRSVLLDAGRGAVSDADNRPGSPSPLLPAPDLSGWPETIQRLPATLSWPAVDGARGYRLQLGATEDFLVLLQERTLATPSIDLALPGDGVFHARVRAIDTAGLEGRDATHALRVEAHPPPPYAIAPAEGGAVPGPRPRFRWTRSEGAARYRLQLARDAGFAAPLFERDGLRRTELRVPDDLAPGSYYWRVGATDSDGRDGPFGDPVRFDLTEPQPGPEIGEDGLERERGSLHVTWPAGSETQRYRFQLARDPDFARIELERELGDNRIELPELRSGTWYMRTQLVEDDGYAHPFGPVQSVRIGCLPCRIALGAAALLLLL